MKPDHSYSPVTERFFDSLIARAEQKAPAAVVRQEIAGRWPEAVCGHEQFERRVFVSGIESFDRLFVLGGVPYGQFIEITGGSCSGKTGLMFRLISGMVRSYGKAAYIDFCNCFFGPAAEYGGLDPAHLLVVKPDSLAGGIRAAELLLKHREVTIAVCDLVGTTRELPITLLHRLRRKTVRARGLVIFLTDRAAEIIPASMASLRLSVDRIDSARVAVQVVKSRLCKPGQAVEVVLEPH
ncbi:MAG: hypothetical protein RBT76_03765 [candidate division Zixibacteria bacterium]|jgi:RecA/RadA recombinase|nr:hypothetical protein [candidate division Zixibacteria bacterium]